MRSIVTLAGIDEAINNLGYTSEGHIKTRVIRAIRQFYSDENSTRTVTDINTDDLIRLLWDTDGGSEGVKNRRKNYSSIKSSINADLTKLHEDGKNPEGITIGRNNTFDMSDKVKTELLENFSGSGDGDNLIPLGKINDVLGIINDLLKKDKTGTGIECEENRNSFKQLKDLIQSISQSIGISGESVTDAKETVVFKAAEGVADDLKVNTDEDIEVVEDDQDLEVLEEDEDLEDAVIEELPEDEDIEVVEEDEELEDAEIEEVPEDEDLEVVEEDEGIEDAQIEEIDQERLLADEFNNMLSEMDRYYNQYILIPGGRYLVGGKDLKRNGRAADIVDIKAFSFGKFPVTNALFEIFVEKTGHVTTAERIGHGTVYYGRYQNIVDPKTGLKTLNWNSAVETRLIEGACWYQPAGPGSTLHGKRNHPVVQVSLEDAIAFAKWTGKRIPTESQWEAASRTLEGCLYPWPKKYRKGCCNIEDSYIGDTTPVDKYPDGENSLGVMDTLGNVMEWTVDTHQPSPDNRNGILYIIKGGSWISGTDISLHDRSFSESDSTSNILGFRCIAC